MTGATPLHPAMVGSVYRLPRTKESGLFSVPVTFTERHVHNPNERNGCICIGTAMPSTSTATLAKPVTLGIAAFCDHEVMQAEVWQYVCMHTSVVQAEKVE
eukprot:GHVU01090274.1.p1 GENE.GHVU01090274.1~~GHVU01090274.1.p1  ORF type:complete len:101 (+),score=5.91 GHVU01090274.1:27-329(+)